MTEKSITVNLGFATDSQGSFEVEEAEARYVAQRCESVAQQLRVHLFKKELLEALRAHDGEWVWGGVLPSPEHQGNAPGVQVYLKAMAELEREGLIEERVRGHKIEQRAIMEDCR